MANINADKKTTFDPKKTTNEIEFKFDEEFERKIKLNDESEEYIYSRGPKYSDDVWPIQCFLCRMGRIINEKKFQNHLKNEKHIENYEKALKEPPNAEEFRQPYEQIYSDRMNLKNPIKIYPGESIAELTTDYTDRLMPMKEFVWDNPPADGYMDALKSDIIMDFNKKSPLLGLCYGFKMAKDKKISYYCGLCDLELNELNAYQHFNGKDHFNRYVTKHFSGTMEKLSKIQGITEDQKITILRSIYHKLENWKGHRPFYLVNGKAFNASKERFIQRANRIYHYCDTTIIFSEGEMKDMFEKIKKRQILVPNNPERLMKQPKTEEELTKLPDDVIEVMPEIIKKDNSDLNRQKSRKRKNKGKSENIKPNTTGEGKHVKVPKLKLDESPTNWQKYRNLCQRALASLNAEYQKFSQVSERHPKYQEEWKRFWRNKTVDLKRERINPNNYNFLPEWNNYWMRYLEHCFKKDADKCKFEFRKNLKLPFRGRTPEPPNVFEGCKFDSNTGPNLIIPNNNDFNSNVDTSGIKQSGPVPLMSVGCGSIFSGNQMPRHNVGINANVGGGLKNDIQPPILPVQQIQQIQQQKNIIAPQQNSLQDKHQQPQVQQQEQRHLEQQNVASQENNTPASVLSVLRLLAALENELGSLGPTANQLLGKAILYEKESKQSANELLHETEYYSLFATSLEKLKGVLLAGLIPELKINVTRNCINDLEKILNLFEEYLRRNPDAAKNHVQSSVVLRKHQFASPEITNISSNSNNNGNNNYNMRSQQRGGDDMRDGAINNDKWNNNENLRGSNVSNQMNSRNDLNSNKFDRQNNNQVGRGNYNNNLQGGNNDNRPGNFQNNDYNRSMSGMRNEFSQNQRGPTNSGPSNQWDSRNLNDMNQERRDINARNNNFNQRELGNNPRNDNGGRFNGNNREFSHDNQRIEENKFNQINNRDNGDFNRRNTKINNNDFNRKNTNMGDGFNNRNTNFDYNQRNNRNFEGNANLNNDNDGLWRSNQFNSTGVQNQSKNLPSLLANNFGGGNNNFPSYGNVGGRGFTRR